jgi:uncharacterized protein YqgV (UPF0045/DUF77 family)
VAEFTIEPFVEGDPGIHVQVGLDTVRKAGLDPEVGPFGSTVTGDLTPVCDAMARMVEAATLAGASRVSVQVTAAEGD